MSSLPEIDSLSYEAAREELVRVVSELEQGGSTLEHSLALWERGEALAAQCERWLIGAKARLDAARAAQAGAPSEAPGDAPAAANEGPF